MGDKSRSSKGELHVEYQIEEAQVLSGGEITLATFELHPNHLVLTQKAPPSAEPASQNARPPPSSWIAYPLISFCTFRPTPPASEISSSIRLRGRDFRFMTINIVDDKQAKEAFDRLKEKTCRLGSIEKLYAFTFKRDAAPPAEKNVNGWAIYDPKAEWRRQGISEKGADRGWRISKINVDYSFSPTYPALLPVPSTISDSTLNHAGKYRSRVRIPVLTYLHPVNNCSITRSSQPIVGIRGNRSIQDQKLVSACFSACASPDDDDIATPPRNSAASSQNELSLTVDGEISETERVEDELIRSTSIEGAAPKTQVYGAQRHNLIVDARPTVNALAMQAVGLGSENMDDYKFATKAYLGIDNIHVMRSSLEKVVDAIKDHDVSKLPPNRELLAKSGWLKHITGLLDGSALIARQVGIQHSHVLIHCSDGWDRTSQLSALSQILLDPYYRTIDGFIVLIEKDWLAFGHMFQHRSGFLGSEKWFATQNDALAGSAIQPGGSGEGRGDTFENALLSAKRFFNKSSQNSQNEAVDDDGEVQGYEESPKPKKGPLSKDDLAYKQATKPKETSPVFHQFLDCVYQLLRQFPTRFEFNERFLRRLLFHCYSCRYGTFLYNNEKDRLDARVQEKTLSVWSHFLSLRHQFTNPDYDPEINDHVKGKERLLFPKLEKVRWWHELFNRTDEEMNGPSNAVMERYLGTTTSDISNGSGVLTGVENANSALGVGMTKNVSNSNSSNSSTSGFASLREGIAGLGIGKSLGGSGSRSPGNVKQAMEVEMQ